jgi:hypothetical protein
MADPQAISDAQVVLDDSTGEMRCAYCRRMLDSSDGAWVRLDLTSRWMCWDDIVIQARLRQLVRPLLTP